MRTGEDALALLCSTQVSTCAALPTALCVRGVILTLETLPGAQNQDERNFVNVKKLKCVRERKEGADKFRRKLEELEKEKKSLKFQLPSRHPSVSSFLDRFITQVQAALRWAADHRVRHEENDLCHEKELLRSTYQERMQVSATKRSQLFQEKKRLQKEIEDLRTRLTILEAKDQQLRREIDEQDRLIQSQDCELTALLGCISLRELQEISKAVDDTLASSYQIPFSLDLPGTIKSPSISWVKNFAFSVMKLAYIEFENLQEKERLFSMSIKETTAKVCTSQKLCSTLRRKVSDIETQLPALLEAKMLAVSASPFLSTGSSSDWGQRQKRRDVKEPDIERHKDN
ncbi:Disrupted in schizophrenia 1 protein [Pitangus sulphuratus]|nr:Disrupted in schizophrenia 1 protein [Pitangus sulphuratus]